MKTLNTFIHVSTLSDKSVIAVNVYVGFLEERFRIYTVMYFCQLYEFIIIIYFIIIHS